MNLRALARLVPGVFATGADVEVTGVTHDSRRVRAGDLFVALPGANADGRRFVADALARGAAAIAVPDDAADTGAPADVPALRLSAPRTDMAALAAAVYGHPSRRLKLVGVTGTNGKTTITTLIAAAVAAAGQPVGLVGTVAHRVGDALVPSGHTTPEAPDLQALLARMLAAGVRIAAMEVSSIGLAEHRVDACEFAVAAFTNLTPDHLDYHGTMAAYGDAKARLFASGLAAGGIAVVDVDDPFGATIAASVPQGREIWTVSLRDPAAAVRYAAAAIDGRGIRGTLVTPRGAVEVECPLLGEHNARNVAAAAACAVAADVPPEAVATALRTARVPGRLEAIDNALGLRVLVDYAHSPDALGRVLSALRPLTDGTLWCVFGCGGDRDATKRGPMGAAAAAADAVIVTSDNPRTEDPAAIAAAAVRGAVDAGRPLAETPAAGRTYVELDRRRAIRAAIAAARPGDTVLIAGKGHETYQQVGRDRLPFDDAEEARRALAERGEGTRA